MTTSRSRNIPGSLLIHAGLSLDSYTEDNIAWLNKKFNVHIPMELDTGGIVDVVEYIATS